MNRLLAAFVVPALLAAATAAHAGPAVAVAVAEKQAMNLPTIAMFLAIVAVTLGITYWAMLQILARGLSDGDIYPRRRLA